LSSQPLLRIGSRSSRLARWQAEHVAERISCCTAMVWVKSGGDADRQTDLAQFGGTGIFTAELHRALYDDRVDVAVHSLKDLPAGDEPGITLACVLAREDTRDALVARDGLTLAELPEGARVGSGSPRRVAQLLRVRPDLRFEQIRGNVDTRIAKVHDGPLDATLLALAGLRRLGREDVITEVLPLDVCVPAAGQGAIGITMRENDAGTEACLAPLRDVSAAARTAAERAALHELGAGCHTPVGAHATIENGTLHLHVRLCSLDGATCLEYRGEGALGAAAQLGKEAAAALREQGAGPLLEESA